MKRLVLFFSLVLGVGLSARAEKAGAAPEVPKAALPQAVSLKFEPEKLVLEDGRDERKFIVWGVTKEGEKFDLSAQAMFWEESPVIDISKDGLVRATAPGDANIKVTAGGIEASVPVKVMDSAVPPVRFVRDVTPMMARVGCNAGTCHGSAKGKNGFKLSLRGYDPDFDYQALINDISGRRFNRVVVEESLMLLKPTAEVPHEGRQVFKVGSREYNLLRDWIKEGAKFEDVAAARATSVEILPTEINLALPGMNQRVLVLAHYKDGKVRDVTRDAVITSNNEDVAKVKDGMVSSIRRGEAALLVRYEGNYAAREVAVMGDRTGYQWVEAPEYNFIDKHVDAKLKKIKSLPSEVCTDAEFIRRVSLDITGLPPKADRVRAFLADKTPSREKREKLLDELLNSKDYVEYWSNRWADLLQCSSEHIGDKAVWQYREWIRAAVRENRPYDQFVRQILLAEGNAYQNPAVNYYRVLREPGKIAEDVSQTFLGVRFNCNKCHDHPFERWTQNQYYEFAAYFARLQIKRGFDDNKIVKDEAGSTQRIMAEEIVYHSREGEVTHPKSGQAMSAKAPFGNVKPADEDDRRVTFVEWLTSKENPLFAKSMANRTWSYFFGRGIIDPVDDIRASNPASNGPLLDQLTDEFLKSGFDTKKLIRTICLSRTYQSSFTKNKWNEDDKMNFASAQPRRLSAEQMVDAVALVTGYKPNYVGMPAGMRAAEAPDARVAGDDFLTLFGRPKRQSACECERSSNLTLSHAMSLINGSTVGEAVNSPNSSIVSLVNREADDKKVIEELYYIILSRPPNEKELAMIDLKVGANRLEAAQDLAWALLNSPAFLFNR